MSRPRIAVSIAFEAPREERPLFRGKWLQYVEQSILHAVARAGGLPVMLPSFGEGQAELLEFCDGLLLTGGADVAPESYGETAQRPEWGGDLERDVYELGLLAAARERELPVLGVCRGCQILAVGSGGRLVQDIASSVSGALPHRDPERYDQLRHAVRFEPGSRVCALFGSRSEGEINSVHHQSVVDAGELDVVAWAPDGIVEAVENRGDGHFELGVQWHPEWMNEAEPVFPAFVDACRTRQLHHGSD